MPMIEEPPVQQEEEQELVFERVREFVHQHGDTPEVKRLREETRGRLLPIPVSWSPSEGH